MVLRDDRRAARHRFDYHETKQLGPVDRHQQRRCAGSKFGFLKIFKFHKSSACSPRMGPISAPK